MDCNKHETIEGRRPAADIFWCSFIMANGGTRPWVIARRRSLRRPSRPSGQPAGSPQPILHNPNERTHRQMDALTATAYVAIVVLVVLNAWIVRRMKITVREEDEDG